MLHQRDMLVRGSVENNLRMIFGKHIVEPRRIAHRADLHGEVQRVTVQMYQLLLEVVGVVLVNVKDNQLFRVLLCHLAAKLTAD